MADNRLAATEIDDPEDIQNRLIRQKLKVAPSFKIAGQTYVLGSDPLPPRWRSLARPISTHSEGMDLLQNATHHSLSKTSLRRLFSALGPDQQQLTDDEVISAVAGALVSGQFWLIKKNSNLAKGKADKAVFSSLNATYGTKVDFDFLSEWEGGQYLHGYVPFSNGIVAAASGMTIATGFDIGQKSAAEIMNMNLPRETLENILPFANTKFTGLNHDQVLSKVIQISAPVPVIKKEEADLIDKFVHGEHLGAAITAWDGARKAGVPSFRNLPEPWQTVLFSRFFHQGKGAHRTHYMAKFWQAATAGNWKIAIEALEHYPVDQAWYLARVRKEAAHLNRQIPATPLPATSQGVAPAATPLFPGPA